jgi:stage II sporulation protein D
VPRRLAALLPLLLFPALFGASLPRSAEPPSTRRILRLATHRVEVVPLEEYVASVLSAEMGPAPEAALEAQAIAVRSYTLAQAERHEGEGADLCDGTHCQVFRGLKAATAATIRAALATRGLVLVQRGRVIAAPYHAVCGGRTARPRDVWDDEETPDIAAIADDACLSASGASWRFVLPRSEVPALGRALGFPDARFLEAFSRDADGRVSAMRLVAPGGARRIVRAFDFRRAASSLWGWMSVRSTAFEVEETHAAYVLTGRGTGHGAGLCQAGAMARGRRGESRDTILSLYYRGAEVRRLESLVVSR